MPIHEYPYTDFHEMNLDWIIKEMKELIDEWEAFGGNVTATAHDTLQPEVSVSGDLKTNLSFDFGLVRGNEGPRGPEGPEGPQGKGLEILGVYATLSDLQTAHPTGNAGDIYLVGSGGSYVIYVWSEDNSDWENGGPITSPVPASASPLMDDVAAVGSSLKYAREDHVHPSDTSKQDALVSGTNIKELNGYSLLGSGTLTVQETLVSGTNIKTINSNDILGSGDITVQDVLVSGTNIKTINSESLLGSTDIAVQVPLVSGTNIKTINSESLLGSTDIAVQVPLVSGTNIRTINNTSLLGSGNISINASITVNLVWSNANPSASFPAQTISVDLTVAKLVLFEVCPDYAVAQYQDIIEYYVVMPNSKATLVARDALTNTTTANPYWFIRDVSLNSTGITVSDCYQKILTGSTGASLQNLGCTILNIYTIE